MWPISATSSSTVSSCRLVSRVWFFLSLQSCYSSEQEWPSALLFLPVCEKLLVLHRLLSARTQTRLSVVLVSFFAQCGRSEGRLSAQHRYLMGRSGAVLASAISMIGVSVILVFFFRKLQHCLFTCGLFTTYAMQRLLSDL